VGALRNGDVHLFVRLSVARTVYLSDSGSGGLSCRPFWPHWLVTYL